MTMRPVLLGMAALFCPPLMAQTNLVVIPRDCALVDGDGSHSYPFTYTIIRDQVLVLSGAVAPGGGTLQGVAFRQDGISTSTYAGRAYSLRLDLYQTPVKPSTMTSSFAANRGGAPATTVFQGVLQLPALAPTPTRPAPFTAKVLFAKAYTFTTAKGNLLLEFVGTSTTPGFSTYRVDGISRPRVSQGSVQIVGQGCRGGGGETADLSVHRGSWVAGGVAHVAWGGTPVFTNLVSWLGNRNAGATPYPLPLDLSPLGAPGCSLHCNILVTAVQGRSSVFAWGPLPTSASIVGTTLWTQGAATAPGINALGVVTTSCASITVGPAHPTSDVHTNYSTFSTTASTGWCNANFYGPVMEFRGVFH